jgi:L-iditol 2-dehydrogenase
MDQRHRRLTTAKSHRRAVVVHQNSDGVSVSCDIVPEPELPDAALRIHPAYIGVCGSDLEQLYGSVDPGFKVTFPHILGHEWSGVVIEAGSQTSRFRAGDRVIGHGSLGGNVWFGVSTDGAMADSFCVPEDMCFPVPPDVSLMRAALVEPLACCLHAMRVAGGTDAGQNLVVFGCGAIGLSMVALAGRLGATVVAVDRSAQRLQLAAELGADHCVNSSDGEDAATEVRHLLGGRGADLSVEASGAASAQAAAIDVTDHNARVLFMGLGHERADHVSLHQIQNRNLRLLSSTGAPPEIWEPTLRILRRTGLDLTPVVSDVFDFWDCRAALDAARDAANHAKVMLSPDGGGGAA